MYGCNKNVCSHAHKTTRDSFHTQTPTHTKSYTKTHTGNYNSALSSSYRWCFGSGPQISQLGHYKQPKGMHLKTHLTDRHLCYLSLSVSWKWVYFICMQKKNSLYFIFFQSEDCCSRTLCTFDGICKIEKDKLPHAHILSEQKLNTLMATVISPNSHQRNSLNPFFLLSFFVALGFTALYNK